MSSSPGQGSFPLVEVQQKPPLAIGVLEEICEYNYDLGFVPSDPSFNFY